jgi:hypothetical protein
LSNPEWRPNGITTSSGQMHWNTGIFSNSDELLDTDGCPDRKVLVVRMDVAD